MQLINVTPVYLVNTPDPDIGNYGIHRPHPELGAANDLEIDGWEIYRTNRRAFREGARRESKGLQEVLHAEGGRLIQVEPRRRMFDQPFTADSVVCLDGVMPEQGQEQSHIAIVSHFTNTGRQAEVKWVLKALKEALPGILTIACPYNIEGSGDNVYDKARDIYWSGYTENPCRQNAHSGRSERRAHEFLQQHLGVRIVGIAVKRPIYHVDLCVGPLTFGHVLCYQEGMQPHAYENFRTEAFRNYGLPEKDYLIPVSKEDAMRGACNVRCIGKTVIMPTCSKELQNEIKRRGYKVVAVPMIYFMYAAGGVHCSTNEANEPRIPGGYLAQLGYEYRPLTLHQ